MPSRLVVLIEVQPESQRLQSHVSLQVLQECLKALSKCFPQIGNQLIILLYDVFVLLSAFGCQPCAFIRLVFLTAIIVSHRVLPLIHLSANVHKDDQLSLVERFYRVE